VLLAGCETQDDSPTLGFSVVSGVQIPAQDELKSSIDSALRRPEGSRGYVMQANRWVPVTLPAVTKHANATVRSFSPTESAAFVEVQAPEHKTWVLQIWRFEGGRWTGAVGAKPPAPTLPKS
jgi:hypothetical protein